MEKHGFRRRITDLATVMGLGIVMPIAFTATPAHAAAQLEITKTHQGNFPLGVVSAGQYTVTVTNSGSDPANTLVTVTDVLPTGLVARSVQWQNTAWGCTFLPDLRGFRCQSTAPLPPGVTWTFTFGVDTAVDSPCNVTNTVVVSGGGSPTDSASDPTTLVGGDCTGGNGGNGDGGGDGGSILPVSLNGVIPLFNNITTNNNIKSPGATNNSRQTATLNAP
ncbi:hypothetical protein [Streptomyces sp. NPDC048357]|uniref:hypothetical protein n=1 Tax=Streptomyces sp. NPDC048357 TaxID=3154719 RepID=UPI003438736B